MANDRTVDLTISASVTGANQSDFQYFFDRNAYPDEAVDPSGGNAARTDGGDTRLYQGGVQFPREIVAFEHDSASAAGDAVIAVWGKVPDIDAATGATVTLQYGDGALTDYAVGDTYGRNAVWSDCLAVLHLVESGDGTSGEYVDSTGNGYTGRGGNGTGTRVPSQTTTNHPWGGNWQEFDGSDDFIQIENSGSALDASDITVQIIARALAFDAADSGVISNRDSAQGNNFFQITMASTRTLYDVHDGTGDNFYAGAAPSTGTTYHYTLTGSGTAAIGYRNGSAEGSDTTIAGDGQFSTTYPVLIGNYFDHSAARSMNMQAGEVRIRLGVLSADWIAAEYNNQSAPGTYISVGTPEAVGGATTGTGGLTHPGFSIGALGGMAPAGIGAVTMPAASIAAVGGQEIPSSGAIVMPPAQIAASGSHVNGIDGSAAIVMPAGQVSAQALMQPDGVGAIVMALFSIGASGVGGEVDAATPARNAMMASMGRMMNRGA